MEKSTISTCSRLSVSRKDTAVEPTGNSINRNLKKIVVRVELSDKKKKSYRVEMKERKITCWYLSNDP